MRRLSVSFFNTSICLLLIANCLLATSCSVTKQISKQANAILLNDSAIRTGHIGISIYEPATNKYLYNHNATQYFIPASNTKLFTLYAGMKYLGDSLVGGYYQNISDSAINFIATGDPTFLHPDFKNQPVLDFLKKEKREIYLSGSYNDEALGYGWAWDDYSEDYMAERNIFPIFGNLVNIKNDSSRATPIWKTTPAFFSNLLATNYSVSNNKNFNRLHFSIKRNLATNKFDYPRTNKVFLEINIPYATYKTKTTTDILKSDFQILFSNKPTLFFLDLFEQIPIKTQPSDSLFKRMMQRSDNFFAEQTLIMASKRGWNNLADKDETLVLIDTVLKLHLIKLAQRPKWVDGSGLSRYNLFTPQSFVQILNQLKVEFGLNRLKNILPTGGTGTLSNYYKKYAGNIFAKTGTLSNNCALSGYLITNKGKLLIFSILNNNYITGATPVRKAVEKFLVDIIEKY